MFFPIKQDLRIFLTESQIQARFKYFINQVVNFKQDLRIQKSKKQFQARSENRKDKILITSKIQE